MKRLAIVSAATALVIWGGCKREAATPSPDSGAAKPATPDHRDKEGASPPDAAGRPAAGAHDGEVIKLGTTTIAEWTVRASRDAGSITPGGEAPIDVWLTTADSQPAEVSSVRFWIGVRDAKASVKAKAAIEDPKVRNHWHTHVEVPDPLPEGSELWVEIELDENKSAGSLGLKP